MSTHVLLNLLNELRKSGKMRGLPNIALLFCKGFNTLNYTGARMLDSIYHMTLKLFQNCIFGIKKDVDIFYATSGLSILMYGVISLPDGTSCGKIDLNYFKSRYVV